MLAGRSNPGGPPNPASSTRYSLRIEVEESQRPRRGAAGIFDTDSRRLADARSPAARPAEDADWPVSDQISPTVEHCEPQCGCELARPRQQARCSGRSVCRPQQHRLCDAFTARHNVRAGVHAVNQEDVQVAAVRVHRLDARGPSSPPRVGRSVGRAEVGLGLHDAAAVPPPAPATGDPGAQEVAGHHDRGAAVKRPGRLDEAARARIESEARIGGAGEFHRIGRFPAAKRSGGHSPASEIRVAIIRAFLDRRNIL